MKFWRLKLLALFAFCFFSLSAQALEIEPYTGVLNYTNMDGCCKSSPDSRVGFGVMVRLPTHTLSSLDFAAYTDRRWSEFLLMKTIYLLGEESTPDPSLDSSVKVRRVSDWKLVFSPGLGYFTHSTRTIDYDLPAIVSGLLITSQTSLIYAIDDRWAVSGKLQLGFAWAKDDKGYQTGLFLGVNYRP